MPAVLRQDPYAGQGQRIDFVDEQGAVLRGRAEPFALLARAGCSHA